MRRNRIARASYWAVVHFIRLCTFLYVRGPKVEGRENIPKQGGAILVSNHLNNADPCVIPGALNRRVISMAKKEMFKWPIVNILFLMIGAFPVDREGADLGALREAQRTVNSGLLLLMFPEGHRSKDRQLRPGFPGSALIAYRTGAPMIPVAVTGTEGLKWPWLFIRPFVGPRVTIRFGPAFYPPAVQRLTTQAAKEATDDIMMHIARLLPPEYQGEFRDRVAGEQRTAATAAETARR
jgi:1-acyl-sn-glycerol-3-phosphate acyltransferase